MSLPLAIGQSVVIRNKCSLAPWCSSWGQLGEERGRSGEKKVHQLCWRIAHILSLSSAGQNTSAGNLATLHARTHIHTHTHTHTHARARARAERWSKDVNDTRRHFNLLLSNGKYTIKRFCFKRHHYR